MTSPHVVVIGAGISGLAAAWFLSRAGARVTVLEGSPQVGGKLRVSEIAGIPVDEGAEALLARRPEGVDLIADLGLSDRLVGNDQTASAGILIGGRIRPLPAGQVMGIPTDMVALARSGVLSYPGMVRAGLDLVLPATPRGTDVSVAGYIGARLGPEVVDRLVEPLLGGVYAGRAEDLSLDSTLPMMVSATRTHRSLIAAVRAMRKAGTKNAGPMFATLTGGLGSLPPVLADRIVADGGTVRTGAMVRELTPVGSGWRLTIGSAADPEYLEADGVVITAPARPAGRLLADVVPAAARELDRIEYASMALVTLAYAPTAFRRRPQGSGYLVPASEGRTVKAVTFSTIKWPHLAERDPDVIVIRCSIGRAGDEQALQRSDEDLKAAAMAELAETCHAGELPLETRVTRWGGGLPQYNVGHADRVARIRAAVAGHRGLAVAGAPYDGIGIPACIASARAAAGRVAEDLIGAGRIGAGQ